MYYFYIIGKTICLFLPRKLAYSFARWLATCQYYFSKKDRVVVINNLYPIIEDKKKREECAKKVFINFAYYLVDFFRYSKLNEDFVEKYVRISGLEFLEEATRQQKGVIAVTAHIGNYELAGAVTSLAGYKVNAVALSHKDKRVNDFFDKQRGMVGINVIPASIAIKRCFSILRNGELVAFLGDRVFSGSGLVANMFSRQALLPRGPAFFSLKTQASFLPAFFVRENKNFYHLIFEKPINTKGLQTEEDVVKEYSLVLEKYIMMYPDQWYLFQPYWL
ncbi:MAG: lysophospholipid acyltransferase family protein [Candidatus Omnitrophica bacterium]|jgi:KDO2-lipid IV(A) lauroyltransferase|nr:lysophospholipid acyltransferase family protein [Candidatus Omnitrophota bacterium]